MSTAAPTVLSAATLTPAERPTMYFVGVSTGSSLIMRVFGPWAELLGLGDCELRGIDLPLGAAENDYRAVVDLIGGDERSLGALVTTHKLDLYAAARDRFAEVDGFGELMREVSSISKRDGRLLGHAKDPISSALALDAFVPAGHWAGARRDAIILGAGGAATAIAYVLATGPVDDRPARITVTDVAQERLDGLADALAQVDGAAAVETMLVSGAAQSDALLDRAPDGSLVVNATGLGKDGPGSPLSDAARFPRDGLAWELNYRGELRFLAQAREQAGARGLTVEDGWTYFIHGWTQVIAEVFDVEIATSGAQFDALVAAADRQRGPA
jgi:shikimate 5-dehydrogenase